MAYHYLGYGITNDKGIAKLEFDANGDPITHSYTGTGAGELDIIASLDDSSKISDSSIQSETYDVWDCLLYDIATYDTHTNNFWASYNASLDRPTDNTGTVFTSTSDGTGRTGVIDNTARHSPNMVIEFDVVAMTGRNEMSFWKDGSTEWTNRFDTATNGGIGHWKIEITPTSQKAYFEGVQHGTTGNKAFSSNIRIQFVNVYENSTRGSIKIKDFKIYSI